MKVGTVNNVSDVIRGGIIPAKWLKIAGWNKGGSNNHVPDRLWRTLVADRGPGGSIPPGWYRRACLHCLVNEKIVDGDGDLHVSSPLGRRMSEMTAAYLKRVESVIWKRKMFEGLPIKQPAGSSLPLFGLVPEDTQTGDELCILFGCTVPVVLRKVVGLQLSQPLYELIGEAYIHGKMDGEALADPTLVDAFTEWFDLQ